MSPTPSDNPIFRIVGFAGVALFVLMAFCVPLAFAPPSLIEFQTATAEIKIVKVLVTRLLAAGILFASAIQLLAPGSVDALRRARLPLILLFAGLCSSLISVLLSSDPAYSLRAVSTATLLTLVACIAPVFLTTPNRIRAVLYGCSLSAALVAGIAVLGASGWGGVNAFIYGADPLAILREGRAAEMGVVEGGTIRGATIATLGNPEYTGTFLAAGFLLAGSWLLDGWGSKWNRTWVGWSLGLGTMALMGAAIVATGTRGAWLVVLAGLVVRWLARIRLRGWILAAGLMVVVLFSFLMNIFAGLVVFGLGCGGVLAHQIRTGRFLPAWKSIQARTRVLMVLGPGVVLLILVLFSVPGPWNPRGLDVLGRFASATSTEDRSVRERLLFYMLAGEMTLQNPFFGVGPGLFAPNYHRTLVQLIEEDGTGVLQYTRLLAGSWFAENAHNDYFQMAAEKGLVGLALFLGAMTALFRGLVFRVRCAPSGIAGSAHGVMVALAGYLAMMMSSFPLHEGARLGTFSVLLGTALACLALEGTDSGGLEKSC